MIRIIFLLFCLFLVPAVANALDREEEPLITIEFNGHDLKSSLLQLEKQSGCRFIYQDTIAVGLPVVNHKFEDKPVSHILGVLLAEIDFCSLTVWNGKGYVIFKSFDFFSISNSHVKSSTAGVVVDENGRKIQGASVCLKTRGEEDIVRTTDQNGNFDIPTLNNDAFVIVYYLGYLPRIVHVSNTDLIRMEEDLVAAQEVIHYRGGSSKRIIIKAGE